MLQLPPEQRIALWDRLAEAIEGYLTGVSALPVSPKLDPAALRRELSAYDFCTPLDPLEALGVAVEGLRSNQVHTPHPMYFGLFNPASTTMGIAADALAAAFNPQMAAWSHNPFAAEVESHLVRSLGGKFGYTDTDGTFCSGGMEANHTAVLAALYAHAPDFATMGLRALPAQPVMYVSSESHHSLLKAARMSGLGMECVRRIGVDRDLKLIPEQVQSAVARDIDAGHLPFLIAGTAGTTSSGAIDPLPELAQIARENRLWFHVDAAWGGAAALAPELKPLLSGIELSDSITFDAHKFLSVPMGAGLFLTRHKQILGETFRVPTAYMPREASDLEIVDPHLHSMQWSRRFTGLKLFLSLLVAGWDGYTEAIRRQTQMGQILREELALRGWEIVNNTPLPVVCFRNPTWPPERHHELAMRIVSSGEAWISTTVLAHWGTAIRACITNYLTEPKHVHTLVELVSR